MLNSQKFVFPAFCFSIKNIVVASSQAGYISWRDFKDVHEEDEKLKANLRKATKLTYEVLHPGHNKQNVNLALTNPASYFSIRTSKNVKKRVIPL